MKREIPIISYLIAKEWFHFFLGATLIFFILITASTLIAGLLRSSVSSSDVIYNYLIELPALLAKVFPVSCLAASLFSINKQKDRNELAAIFASGYSRKKYVQIIALTSFIIGSIQFVSLSFIQPKLREKKETLITDSERKFRNLKSKGLKASTIGSGKIWVKANHYFLSFAAYSKIDKKLHNVEIYYFSMDSLLTKKVKADSATYQDGTGWHFHNAIIHDNVHQEEFTKGILIDSMLVPLDELPHDFEQFESDITTLNIFKLHQYIAKLKDLGISVNEYEILFLDKITSSLICILFALIAATSIFNPNRRSSSFGKNVGVIFLFTLCFWLISSYSTELGQNGKIPPLVAMLSVPTFFTLLLAHIFFKNRKLAT